MESSARPTTLGIEPSALYDASLTLGRAPAQVGTSAAETPESDTAVSRVREGVTESNGIRLYHTAGGAFPSVTSILSATKPESDKAGLAKWRRKEGAAEADRILAESAARGTAMHAACEAYMRDGTVGEGPWWDSIYPFLKRLTGPELIEARVWHPRGFAGSLDIATLVDLEMAVVDFKTARKRKRREWIVDYCLQVSAYVAGANHVYRKLVGRDDMIRKAWIVVAYADAPADEFELGPQELTGYYKAFCARLDEFNDKYSHRIDPSSLTAPATA